MNILENITIEIAEKISKASLNKTTKPTILFCGCNPHIKKICINAQSELD